MYGKTREHRIVKSNDFSCYLWTCYWGFIRGPVEFEERDNYILDDMIGYGTYHKPPGAKYSLASIPKEWIEKLANKALIDEKCEQLFNRIIKV